MNKAIITVVGQDTVGIIARGLHLSFRAQGQRTRHFADHHRRFLQHDDDCGLLQRRRRIGTVVDDLDKLGEEIGVRIRCQREEIFTKMHRV